MTLPTEILFLRWVTLTEHKWVIFRERRRATDYWIEHPRQILDCLVTAQMQIPASNLRANRFPRFVGNGRAEVDEAPTGIPPFRAAIAVRTSCASASVRQCTIASSA